MLKSLIKILLLCLILPASAMHPVHVSVCNIELSDRRIDITINTFSDDWELAFFHYYGKETSMEEMNELTREWFEEYLAASFKVSLSVDSETLEHHIDSVMVEGQTMKIEMHLECKKQPKSLYLYNAILTDIYADQTNLLIYSYRGKEKGIRFDFKKRHEEFSLR